MLEIRPGQSIELLKRLHILTLDGKINQDSRRKLKQIYHLFNFIEPLLKHVVEKKNSISLVDHGAGKSYLGFILYDLFLKNLTVETNIWSVETRPELIDKSIQLKNELGFKNMNFINASVEMSNEILPSEIDVVTALHACDTATDDAINFALNKKAQFVVLVPCCQAEVAALLRANKKYSLSSALVELYRHPIQTREFGSHLTNVLRCLRLESYGYDVTVTELVGFEHSMKNELIIAKKTQTLQQASSRNKIDFLLSEFKIKELAERFS